MTSTIHRCEPEDPRRGPRRFVACEACRREHEDQLELIEMRLSDEHPQWSMCRLKWRARIEYAKGMRVNDGRAPV